MGFYIIENAKRKIRKEKNDKIKKKKPEDTIQEKERWIKILFLYSFEYGRKIRQCSTCILVTRKQFYTAFNCDFCSLIMLNVACRGKVSGTLMQNIN